MDAPEHADASSSPNVSSSIRAEKTALRLIARAEQCTNGLTRKLEKRGFDSIVVNEVILKLTDLNLLDDSRFARLWLESRMRLPRSPRRLLAALCARGIDRDNAQTALDTLLDDEKEFALLTRFAKKYSRKIKSAQKTNNQTHQLKFFLKSEGFSTAAIRRLMGDE